MKLGGQEYAFVLDASPPKEEPKLKPGKEKPPAAAKAAQAKSVWAQQIGAALGTPTAPAESRSKAPRYNRLYFDLNHNGDLTDDKPIEAETTPGGVVMPADYSPLQFPCVDLTIDVDGTKLDYVFFLVGLLQRFAASSATPGSDSPRPRAAKATSPWRARSITLC